MKINTINFLNLNNNVRQFQVGGTSEQNTQVRQIDYNQTLNSAEFLGRSQVNFTGKKEVNNKLVKDDKMFVNILAQELRLSDQDNKKCGNFVSEFLKQNNLKSLSDMNDNNDLSEKFFQDLGKHICNSDFDYEILSDNLHERLSSVDGYKPEVDLYLKDYEILDHVLDKYFNDNAVKMGVYNLLVMEAQSNLSKDLFEPFKKPDACDRFPDFMKEYLGVNADTSLDILIDIVEVANKDDAARRAEIYPWKHSMQLCEEIKDNAIACEIAGQYDLVSEDWASEGVSDDGWDVFVDEEVDNDDEVDDIDDDDIEDDIDDETDQDTKRIQDIMEQLSRRRSGTSVEQISFELVEKYDLPEGAFNFIKDTIFKYDTADYDEED